MISNCPFSYFDWEFEKLSSSNTKGKRGKRNNPLTRRAETGNIIECRDERKEYLPKVRGREGSPTAESGPDGTGEGKCVREWAGQYPPCGPRYWPNERNRRVEPRTAPLRLEGGGVFLCPEKGQGRNFLCEQRKITKKKNFNQRLVRAREALMETMVKD